jgi:hypothetical protein
VPILQPSHSIEANMSDSTELRRRVTDRSTIEDRGFTSPCWISNRAAHSNGYTKIAYQGQTWLTHRFAYTVFIGDIPEGLQIDHLCRVRQCCNPAHLEPVTCRENLLRGDTLTAHEAQQHTCVNGHRFDEANTRITSKGQRACRACDATRSRQYRLRAAA